MGYIDQFGIYRPTPKVKRKKRNGRKKRKPPPPRVYSEARELDARLAQVHTGATK